jgi:RNA-binding protein
MLSGKEKRQLRALGNAIKSSVMIGRGGVTGEVKRFIDEAFNNKSLIKVRVQDTCESDRKEIADILSKLENTEVVQLLGRTILLFRPLEEDEQTQEKKKRP